MNVKRPKLTKAFFSVGLLALLWTPAVFATSSTNFMIEEDFLGGSGVNDSSSANYQSQDSMGAPAAGNSTGTNYQQHTGATTTNDPTLSFIVNSSSVNLGGLSTALTKTGTASFSVLNYTSYGYVVQTIGAPLSNGAHTLAGLSTPSASAAGTEQFGINLVANSSPAIGADPSQNPDNSFSFGQAANDYNTANNFKYVSGDTIATAPKSSGRTDYTVSYIANVSNNTPGGSYSGDQTIVVTGTY